MAYPEYVCTPTFRLRTPENFPSIQAHAPNFPKYHVSFFTCKRELKNTGCCSRITNEIFAKMNVHSVFRKHTEPSKIKV